MEIIEIVTNSTLEEVFRQLIFDPLGLKNTYLPEDENDFIPYIYYKDTAFYTSKLRMSIRASGGCVSTARELLVFVKVLLKGII